MVGEVAQLVEQLTDIVYSYVVCPLSKIEKNGKLAIIFVTYYPVNRKNHTHANTHTKQKSTHTTNSRKTEGTYLRGGKVSMGEGGR